VAPFVPTRATRLHGCLAPTDTHAASACCIRASRGICKLCWGEQIEACVDDLPCSRTAVEAVFKAGCGNNCKGRSPAGGIGLAVGDPGLRCSKPGHRSHCVYLGSKYEQSLLHSAAAQISRQQLLLMKQPLHAGCQEPCTAAQHMASAAHSAGVPHLLHLLPYHPVPYQLVVR